MDLNKLKIFHAVAKFGGITLASSELKLSPSSISASITILENEIGQKLFKRQYRGMKLTLEGEELFKASKEIFENIENILEKLNSKEDKIEGHLTIATSFGIASSNWFSEKIHHISNQLPHLRIKIIDYNEGIIDNSSFDLIICPHIYNRLDLIQEKIKDVEFRLFASQNYVKKFGLPKTIEDLDKHRLIAFSKELNNPFNNADSLLHIGREQKNPRNIFLEVSSSIGLLKLVKLGTGIASLSIEAGLENNLVGIFENKNSLFTTIGLVHHKKVNDLQKIKLFKNLFLN